MSCQNRRAVDAQRKAEETFGQKSVAWSGNHATTGAAFNTPGREARSMAANTESTESAVL